MVGIDQVIQALGSILEIFFVVGNILGIDFPHVDGEIDFVGEDIGDQSCLHFGNHGEGAEGRACEPTESQGWIVNVKDVFKNFPIEADASPQSKVSPYLDAAETYGEKMAHEIYCQLTHDNPELKKLFAEGLKIQNVASFLTIQARAQLEQQFEP